MSKCKPQNLFQFYFILILSSILNLDYMYYFSLLTFQFFVFIILYIYIFSFFFLLFPFSSLFFSSTYPRALSRPKAPLSTLHHSFSFFYCFFLPPFPAGPPPVGFLSTFSLHSQPAARLSLCWFFFIFLFFPLPDSQKEERATSLPSSFFFLSSGTHPQIFQFFFLFSSLPSNSHTPAPRFFFLLLLLPPSQHSTTPFFQQHNPNAHSR